ncbi:MAG: transcriptional repressor LexA [Desulfurella sp.]|jgi:repressor LexA
MIQESLLKERVYKLKLFYNQTGRMPSYSEISDLLGFSSKNAAFKFIEKLIKLNLIKKDSKGKLIPTSLINQIKVLGVVEAGFPSCAEEELLDTVSLDKWLVNNPTSTFMLKVNGDSMIEAGIMPKDYVLVDRSLTPKNKDIVIAQVDGQWTMKYFIKKGKDITLLPANPKYSPIKPKNELKIAGVVTAVLRKLK